MYPVKESCGKYPKKNFEIIATRVSWQTLKCNRFSTTSGRNNTTRRWSRTNRLSSQLDESLCNFYRTGTNDTKSEVKSSFILRARVTCQTACSTRDPCRPMPSYPVRFIPVADLTSTSQSIYAMGYTPRSPTPPDPQLSGKINFL